MLENSKTECHILLNSINKDRGQFKLLNIWYVITVLKVNIHKQKYDIFHLYGLNVRRRDHDQLFLGRTHHLFIHHRFLLQLFLFYIWFGFVVWLSHVDTTESNTASPTMIRIERYLTGKYNASSIFHSSPWNLKKKNTKKIKYRTHFCYSIHNHSYDNMFW